MFDALYSFFISCVLFCVNLYAMFSIWVNKLFPKSKCSSVKSSDKIYNHHGEEVDQTKCPRNTVLVKNISGKNHIMHIKHDDVPETNIISCQIELMDGTKYDIEDLGKYLVIGNVLNESVANYYLKNILNLKEHSKFKCFNVMNSECDDINNIKCIRINGLNPSDIVYDKE